MVRFFLETLIVRSRSEARLRAEVLALRHQLAVLERQVGRPHWQPTDRLVLAALSRVLPKAGLAIAPAQTRDSAPLASGIGPAQVGRLSAPTPPAAAGGPERAARPHSQDGEGERRLGLPEDRGRAAQAGPLLFQPHRPQGAPPPWPGASTATKPAHLGRVRAPARRPDPGHGLHHRGHRLADPALRPLLCRGGQPPSSSRRQHLRRPDEVTEQGLTTQAPHHDLILKASTVDRIRASWIGSEVEQYAGGCINPWVKAPNASA